MTPLAPLATTVAVRERTLPELYDLALLLWRRHPVRLPLVAAVALLPWALLDWWLVAGGGPRDWWRYGLLLLLVSAQIPLATAPITAWLGGMLFAERPPGLFQALRQGWRHWLALLAAGLWRALLSGLPLLLLAWPPHLVEVLVLEGAPTMASWRRAGGMRAVATGGWILHLMTGTAVWLAALWLVVGTLDALLGALLHGDLFLTWTWEGWLPGANPLVHLATWLTVAYLASVRFLAYIDLRTRHEGWELGLRLRLAGERLRLAGERLA